MASVRRGSVVALGRRNHDRYRMTHEEAWLGLANERRMKPFGPYFWAVTLSFVVTSVLAPFSSGSAQTPKVEISAGYQALHALDETLPAGWYVEIARNVNRWFGIVGEVGGAYRTTSGQISNDQIADTASTLHTLMGGVRLSARLNRRIVLVHPVLVGSAHASVRTDAGAQVLRSSETQFALQPGLGINVTLTGDFGMRVAADYRRLVIGGDRIDENEYRFVLGIVLPFGK